MNTNSTLEEKTLAYWNTSTAFHGKPSQTPEITTEKALRVTGDMLLLLGPHRALYRRTELIQDSIVMGNVRKRKSKDAPTAQRFELQDARQKQLAAL